MDEKVTRPVPVLMSKHCKYVRGEMYALNIGDRAWLHSIHGRPSTIVIIESELTVHANEPGDGWCYEVRFTEYDKALVAVSARQLEWIP